MNNINKTTPTTLTPGQKVGGIICKSSLVVGDIIIVWMMNGECKVFKRESIATKAEVYKIDGAVIEEVFVPTAHELLILKTSKGEYVRDFNNQTLEEAELWADYYFEPFTSSFYRQDTRGNWYDIEGYRLGAPVFLKDTVLCSLPGKTSKKSMSFQGQKIVISPSAKLIQVGKLVYDTNLEIVHYFGEKITGLGRKNIAFQGEDVLQEVLLGLNNFAFINEHTKQPYLINNEEIIGHVQTVVKNRHRFEVFKSAKRKYVVEKDSNSIFSFEGEPVALDFSTFLEIGHHELVLAKIKRQRFYMDINTKQPFVLPGMEERIISIDLEMVKAGNNELYNIKTLTEAFVYNETRNEVFKLNDGTIEPDAVVSAKGFETYYAFAEIEGVQRLFYKRKGTLVQLGESQLEIKELLAEDDQKLLNAISTNDEEIVLDARKGFDQLTLAESGDRRIVKVLEKPKSIGNHVLQNVKLQTLGGSEPRVIDLNQEDLAVFTLPDNLKEYPERETASSFQSNPILSIDFDTVQEIDGEAFIVGDFLSFFGNVHSVILQQKNAKPIHLEGAGHRNELVSGFNLATLTNTYHLGIHRMIGAYTLTEDLKENELLFALDTKRSWLSFYDAYLPILKRVVEFKDETPWEYLLFELRELSSTVEYIAIEKEAPHRVLVERKRGKPVPKIVKSKEKFLKTPEEISAIKKFFLVDPGFLMEVD